MGVSAVEKEKLAAYQLKGVAQVWFKKWKGRGGTLMQEYALKFTQFDIYASTMVANSRAMLSKFVEGASDLVIKKGQESPRGQGLLMVIFLILGLKGMSVLNSGKGFPVKALHILRLLSSIRIGCLTINFKEEIVVDILCLLAQGVVRNMFGKCLADIDGCFNYENNGDKMSDFLLLSSRDGSLSDPIFHIEGSNESIMSWEEEIMLLMCKANVVVDALGRLSMGSVAHVENGKKELVQDLHRLSRLGVCLVDSNESGVIVQNGSESSLVSDVKAKQDLNLVWMDLKKSVSKKNY
ncbi:hypothetical protein MTR67_022999 [Solanum verrucosum]|uniref:Uncharacterized protein n=1 Tax=Solanum verrucosum TaxID=315347 RepID=A0AAF0R122_SOLVR|nr:hypothetical protein MTR67_022999 [Solanum verrucosum]